MYVRVWQVYAYYVHWGACGAQKRVSDPLKLELQGVVSYAMWVLEIEPQSLQKQQMLLITESSLQCHFFIFCFVLFLETGFLCSPCSPECPL